jgi:diguanylate cyclase (GGDEF)-like protein
LWYGGLFGANSFYPSQLSENNITNRVVLTSLTQNGVDILTDKALSRLKELHISADKNMFEFSYVALNFTKSHKNRYKYILEGFDKDWYSAGAVRNGRYSELPGGTYTLRIRGSNSDLKFSDENNSVSITIIVDDPWYKTAVAYVIYFILTILTICRIIKLRTYYIRKEKLQLERKVRERTAELKKSNILLREAKEQLEKTSVTDHLTQIYNRSKLDEVLFSEANRSNRFQHSFGVILLDVDHFKSVNDTYGHQMGDIVLQEFAEILETHSRKTDTVGRWGGEEFLIICSETDLDGILNLAEKLREEISKYPFHLKEQKTASFGVSTYKYGENISNMLKRADDALYNAKKKGRNIVQYL